VSVAGSRASCPGPINPGAVALTFPSAACITVGNGADTYLFSGYQYDWIVVHQPSGCSNSIGAASDSAYIGLTYTPSSLLSITSAYVAESSGMGGIIASTISFSGNMPKLTFSSMYAPVPPASRLTA
jgi:hypothetical protein